VKHRSLFVNKPRYKIFSRFVYFTGVGAITTLIQYSVVIGLAQLRNASPVLTSAVGFILGAVVSYILNYRYTFQSTNDHSGAMIKFMVVALIGLILNTFIMAVATEYFSLHYLIAQIIATGLVLIWNFSVHLLWTFRE
jgi:putative flippase GtrA